MAGMKPWYAKEVVGVINDSPWGDTFYVSSTHRNASDSNLGKYPRQPLKTVVQAMANCAAGDKILVGAYHTEDISTLQTWDKNDVLIKGEGIAYNKSILNFVTNVAAGIKITGTGVVLHNMRCQCDIDAQTLMFDLAGVGNTLSYVSLTEVVGKQPLDFVKLDAAYQVIMECDLFASAAGTNRVIHMTGNCGGSRIVGNCFMCLVGTGVIVATAASLGVKILDNLLDSLNTTPKPCITGFSGVTGFVSGNKMRVGLDGDLAWITVPGNWSLYGNLGVNDDGEAGIPEGTVSA